MKSKIIIYILASIMTIQSTALATVLGVDRTEGITTEATQMAQAEIQEIRAALIDYKSYLEGAKKELHRAVQTRNNARTVDILMSGAAAGLFVGAAVALLRLNKHFDLLGKGAMITSTLAGIFALMQANKMDELRSSLEGFNQKLEEHEKEIASLERAATDKNNQTQLMGLRRQITSFRQTIHWYETESTSDRTAELWVSGVKLLSVVIVSAGILIDKRNIKPRILDGEFVSIAMMVLPFTNLLTLTKLMNPEQTKHLVLSIEESQKAVDVALSRLN